ncbi:MAG TPA: dihydrolipoamide acetyltransferase family protein [Stellaceae bacterium]|nr:dihydrolipoamide acetyltransferase family protein [Stellaceae bacterium]
MADHVIKLPDVGEGVAEAELVEWHVKVGDVVREDATLAAVMTDKATVEIPSPVDGEVVWLGAAVGDVVAVGSDLVRLKVEGDDSRAAPKTAAPRMKAAAADSAEAAPPAKRPMAAVPERAPAALARREPAAAPPTRSAPFRQFAGGAPRAEGERPLAAPAVRLRAREAGIDLRQVPGTGPAGRITHEDLDAFLAQGPGLARAPGLQPRTAVEEIKVVGLRRRIAEKMAIANARIPHITYVEEVDVSKLEELRATLNQQKRHDQPKLTLLPFIMRAMVRAIAEQPNLNALFDDEAGILRQHAGVHIGIAAQTAAGLMVPVVRHAEARDLWSCGAEVNRLADAAKNGTATREELSGSTITITSLGAMGGLMSTPIINHPEVAIIGVNKILMRPVWDGSAFVPRKMMNLSSSFDHRVIDGFDAARFVQRLKTLLETPTLIFMED